jgi:predicted nucleic acid-binding protein
VEGLLINKELLSKDQIIAPELIIYEVANALWKREYIIKDLQNGKLHLSFFYNLISAGKITVVFPSEDLMQDSYLIAKRNGITTYDAIFVCLAIKLGLTLKTFDKIQSRALKSEKEKEPV